MAILTFLKNKQEYKIEFSGNPTVSELLAKNGFSFFSPCGGKGTCGKCGILLEGDVSAPNNAEIKAGMRLACQARLFGNAKAELLKNEEDFSHIETETKSFEKISKWKYGAAIDIGTTTVVLKLFSESGNCIATQSMLNPQRSISADIIGRIDAALNGKGELLSKQIRDCIETLLLRACEKVSIAKNEVEEFVITGNTAMLYLLTNRSPSSIAHFPFKSETLFGEYFAKNAYLPDCMNAFVGADITCAVLSSGMCDNEKTSLICDIGTNGEIALWKNQKLFVTSTAAGPAFEGAEISSGCGSIPGAIDKVFIKDGLPCANTIDDKPAVGICGSGLVDAVAVFLELGLIDISGTMEGVSLELSANGNNISITQDDIRALQLAKAAIAAGIETVLKASKTKAEDIETLFIAGGFGNHIDLENAVKIGLIPKELSNCTKFIGNAALSGAVLLLFDEREIEHSKLIAKHAEHIDLGGNVDFYETFINKIDF